MVNMEHASNARCKADIVIGKDAKDAAWYYPEPITDKAAPIKDHVAFCKYSELSTMNAC